ncbi:hypothetical protein AB0I28_00490 [Phytomonospora sp. NPDC050363]|uniref:hypothetical protein n=1 Tax=Phytomonospora sp. NPDC050363 TaxID=3155642 RepID=UPI0033E2D1A3
MATRLRRLFSLAVALVAAVWWGVCLTVVTPGTIADQEWAGNNGYWARDVRLTMILLVASAFVWAVAGDEFLSAMGALGALVWTAADILLTRVGVDGPVAAVAVSAVAVACVLAAWWAAARRTVRARRGVLLVAGSIAAITAGLIGGLQSPTDVEAALRVSGLLAGVLGSAVALGCSTLLASGSRSTLIAVGAAALALTVLIRIASPDRSALGLGMLLAALSLTVLTVRASERSGPQAWIASALACFPVVFCAGMFVIAAGFGLAPIGVLLTRLEGHPPVNTADTDVLYTSAAIVGGVLAGSLLRWGVSALTSASALRPPRRD